MLVFLHVAERGAEGPLPERQVVLVPDHDAALEGDVGFPGKGGGADQGWGAVTKRVFEGFLHLIGEVNHPGSLQEARAEPPRGQCARQPASLPVNSLIVPK